MLIVALAVVQVYTLLGLVVESLADWVTGRRRRRRYRRTVSG
jgi:hypothetical protein